MQYRYLWLLSARMGIVPLVRTEPRIMKMFPVNYIKKYIRHGSLTPQYSYTLLQYSIYSIYCTVNIKALQTNVYCLLPQYIQYTVYSTYIMTILYSYL